MPFDCAVYCPKCGQFHLPSFECGAVVIEEVVVAPVEDVNLVDVESADDEDLEAAGIVDVDVDEDNKETTVEFDDGSELTVPEGSLSVVDVKDEKPAAKPTRQKNSKNSSKKR